MSTLIVSGSSDEFVCGIPQNRAPFWDGTRYWIFYQEAAVLKCVYGTSLASLASTTTDGGSDASGIANDGKGYSLVFATVGGKWYAFSAMTFTSGTDRLQCWRWQLTSSGLGTPTKVLGGQGGLDFTHSHSAKDYGNATASVITYNGIAFASNDNPNRSVNSDMTNDTAEFNTSPSLSTDAEHAVMWPMSDGYVNVQIDQGGSSDGNGGTGKGHLREWRKTNRNDSWGSEQTIEAAGAGNFQDQNYALNTSHTGQQDTRQTDDGKVWIAYINDSDTTDGDHGAIVLKSRGNTQASSWSTESTDVIGSSGEAWHVAMATDGQDIWIFYVKESSGKDSAIYYRRYDVGESTFDSEVKLADIQASHEFTRMCTSYRAYNRRVVLVWSEYDSSTYDLMAAEIEIEGTFNPAWYHNLQQSVAA